MSEEDRLEYKKELSVYSKEELIEKYIDELEENSILTNQWYKSSQRIKKAIECIEQHKNIMGFYEEVDGNNLIEILEGSDSNE